MLVGELFFRRSFSGAFLLRKGVFMIYWLIGISAFLIVAYVTAVCIFKDKPELRKIANIVGLCLLTSMLIVMLIIIPTKKEKYEPLSMAGMYIFSVLFVTIVALVIALFGKEPNVSDTKAITFGGIAVALAFGLSYVKIFSLPEGGSVTLASMLPLILYAYLFGAKKGVIVGIIYGLLQCLQSPQVYQPMQVVLDYPVAFGVIGIAGISRNLKFLKGNMLFEFIFGASIAGIGRYIAHFLSGYYVFGSFAMDGYSALGWSLVYNLFVIVDVAIVIALGSVLFMSKSFGKEISKRLYK